MKTKTAKRNHLHPDYVTTGQAAAMLGVAARTISNWVDEGLISAWRVNQDRRILTATIVAFAQKRNMPLFVEDPVCSNKVTKISHDVDSSMAELATLKLKLEGLRAVLSSAEECLSKGTVVLGDSRYVKVDVELRKKFLDKLNLYKTLE